ncbi:MAG: amino acid adenylation domain-containing protein, partial [Chloroflexi bacterium]|nr:amino acid adenylation domain-containing protein [Chloroflexota bacterium]
IPRRTTTGPAPLSFSQQRLWFLDQLIPNSPAYNLFAVFRFCGTLNVPVLEQTINELVKRHESLRTTFVAEDGQPQQVIAPTLTIALPTVDLREVAADDREAQAQQIIDDERQTPFDLAHGPLLRTRLVQLSDDEHHFILAIHHIISDGWSLGVFFKEFGALYTSLAQGQASALPELPIQYADFACWQRDWLSGEVLDRQLNFWKQQVTDAPKVLDLPTDYPRPATQTYKGARHRIELPGSLRMALSTLSQRENSTIFMTLLAAFNVLLYRYTEQQSILVGTPIANRTYAETEGQIGFFANTLVLHGNLSGNPTFRELLGRVREMAMGAYAHQDLPFERLVEELQLERDLARNPLFQVMFSLQNAPIAPLKLHDLTVEMVRVNRETTAFDLMLEVAENPSGLYGYFTYNTDLFAPDTIERMAGHFHTLLENIIATPDQHINDLALLSEAERQQQLVDWNATAREIPQQSCIHDLFAAQAARTSEAIAVVHGDLELSYAQLSERVTTLAQHLRRLGVGPDTLVGVCLERSIEMLVAVLAVLKSGGAYVPLDPSYPADRLAFMLEDAQAAVLLTQEHLLSRLPTHEAKVVCLTRDWAVIQGESEQEAVAEAQVDPANLAYVIYTSGSTGRPKGVQIPHSAVVNFLHSMQSEPGLTAQDTLLSVTTLSFDIAGLELFLPLISGARVVLVDPAQAADGQQLAELIDSAGATVMQATPATWRLLLAAGWQGSARLKILCGGEAMARDLSAALVQSSASLWNMYGPTETTIWSTLSQLTPDTERITIGRPIANTEIYILDPRLQPVPIGVPGELLIGGSGLSRGYLRRPELTAEKFIPHPFGESGARLYRTGDLARYRADGSIEYIGRNDHQVKLRGFRIELGEIEAVIQQHPAIAGSAVLVRDAETGAEADQRLVAYLVVRENESCTADDLRAFLQTRLPAYMVPTAWVVLAAFPLTPNGKLDRRALLADTTPSLEQAQTYVAPSTPEEELMAEIWAEILGREQIGMFDNFFSSGGHSLLATRLIARMRAVFQVELNLSHVFEAPTIAQMLEVVEDLLVEKLEMLSEDEILLLAASASAEAEIVSDAR